MARESVDHPEQKLLGKALRLLRVASPYTAAEAGDRFGIGVEGWRKYERGEARTIFSPDTQHRLTDAIGFTVQDLLVERAKLAGEDPPPAARATPAERQSWAQARAPDVALLSVRDTVQAGAWLMADDFRQTAPAGHPVAGDPRFPQAQQWLCDVRGDSMNQLNIVEGDLVHCVDAVDIRYFPRTGDVIEVERTRFGGQERELTLKQVEVSDGKVLLWPRSSNPRFRTPLELHDGVADGEEFEVRIRALVVASVRRF